MNKQSSRWLVIYLTIPRGFIDVLGCVQADTEQEASDRGRELLGVEVTQAIPLGEIKPGWIVGEVISGVSELVKSP
jgi:hypothetical protein